MGKQHCLDLLLSNIPSSFIAYIDKCPEFQSIDNWLWKCLINENSRKYACLIITSGLCDYEPLENCHQSLKILHTNNYPNSEYLIDSLSKLSYTVEKQDNQRLFIFIESLSWFLFDCPADYEFDHWCQFIVGSLFNLSSIPNVYRIICRFHPIMDNSKGVYYGASSTTIDILEACATSVIHSSSLDKSNICRNRISQSISLFHRRSLQGECNKSSSNMLAFNKSSFSENGIIELDTQTLRILKFSLHKNEPDFTPISNPLPQSTFELTMSESEKAARSLVVLPHEAARLASKSGTNDASCNIQYQPDCFDDLDDEDPDDDLDI
ncbi:unnamed protein product [Trichobilharzia regenti]|uniref:Elongator complex protein 5 n=1 Tax=Trichobilharzia regenti TaxID=157069 RepID=A0A183WS28_TRIRE|nr:unnamed protein product [Trichobilharzia regenti]VDQ10812.1 unnamed protein product [Trichobilharzia regenti]